MQVLNHADDTAISCLIADNTETSHVQIHPPSLLCCKERTNRTKERTNTNTRTRTPRSKRIRKKNRKSSSYEKQQDNAIQQHNRAYTIAIRAQIFRANNFNIGLCMQTHTERARESERHRQTHTRTYTHTYIYTRTQARKQTFSSHLSSCVRVCECK